jgi:CSLREA domain-containing protein
MPHVTEFIRPRLRSSFVLVVLLFALRLVPIAGAAIINVNTLADEDVSGNGTCSLREAMTAAANQAAYHECPSGTGFNDTITFSVTGLISLASPLPTVENTLEIVGPGISSLTITGHDSVGMFFVDGSLNLHDLSLTDARAVWGAAIYVNDGQSLSVSRVLFLGNTATSSNGGAIYNDDASSIHITDSWFVDNFAQSGGAIYVGDSPTGATTITNSMFDGNEAFAGSGGAIANGSEGLVSIVNCTFTENTASARGGAVALLHNNNNLGHISITHATFAENSAGTSGGTLYADGVGVTVASSIISGSASCSGSIADGGYNIDDGLTCPFSSGTSLSLTNTQL